MAPAPPPPPPGPPPPPAMPSSLGGASTGQERNQLLQSIRQGTKLKKTVTKDRSGPLISGAVVGGDSTNSSPSNKNNSKSARAVNGVGPPGLGGLFAGGMPKLKPTGLSIATTQRENGQSSPGSVEGKIINRGPPPQPPPASNKPSLSSTQQETTTSEVSSSPRPAVPSKPPAGGYGKPHLAPRPPGNAASPNVSSLHPGSDFSNGIGNSTKPSPPPKLVALNGNGRIVGRTQSMRASRSPPVAPPNAPSPFFNSPNAQSQQSLVHGKPYLHVSQDALNSVTRTGTLPHNFHNTLKLAPSPPAPLNRGTPPARAPNSRPPPPPASRPAPPNMAPPPPPHHHRTSPAPPPPPPPVTRITPTVPCSAPPAPPARNSSMRNGPATFINELENRFIFHNVREFPEPDVFQNLQKIYSSRTATTGKQQAPLPPTTHLQLTNKMWSNQTSQC